MIENGGLNLLYTVRSRVRISGLRSELSNRFPPIFIRGKAKALLSVFLIDDFLS